MTWILVQILIGFLYGNLIEWIAHKYFLHGLGKNKKSVFAFHWHRHHKACRKCKYLDPDYFDNNLFKMDARGKEVLSLFLLAFAHFPIFFILPYSYFAACIWIIVYYFVHMKSHRDPEWGFKWFRHHYDHHMGKTQDANWGVVCPFWDYVFCTRIEYNYDKNRKCIGEKKSAHKF